MQKRKSAVDLTDLAIGILILGITVIIGARMLVTFRDNRLTDVDTFTTVNETLTTVTEAGEALANSWFKSVSSCINSTDSVVIAPGNYTTSIDDFGGGSVATNANTDSNFNNTDWDCTYTSYNKSNPQWQLPNDAAIGLSEYGNWFDIIVIVGVAGLILALIFMAFGRGGGGESVTY